MTETFTTMGYGRIAESDSHRDAELDARARGYAAGYAEGARAAAHEYELRQAELEASAAASADEARAVLDRQNRLLEWVIDALDMRVTPVVEQAQRSLAEAAFDLAEALVGIELSRAETSARSVVERVLGAVDASDVVTRVRVNPAEAALVVAQLGARAQLTIVADPRVTAGDAIAELPDGFIDARIRTALHNARQALEADGPAGEDRP